MKLFNTSFTLLLLCISTRIFATDAYASLTCNEAYHQWVSDSHLKYPNTLNLEEGKEELKKLIEINEWLENTSLTQDELFTKGFIKAGNQNPIKKTKGADQNLEFTELLFPIAHTGIYLPKVKFDAKIHKTILMLLPGIGSTFSNAQTVTNIALTFTKPKLRPELGDTKMSGGNPIINFRAYSIPVDMPLNGMATLAPDAFATAEGTLAVTRHVHLILMKLYPNIPISIAGRSQGGLIAMKMGERYGPNEGLHAVIALNPSPTDLNNLKASVRIHEEDIQKIVKDDDLKLEPKPWQAYRIVTSTYPNEVHSKAKTHIFLGRGDPSYQQDIYLNDFIKPYLNSDLEHRKVTSFGPNDFDQNEHWKNTYAHDLWSIHHPNKIEIISKMKEVLESTLSTRQ